MEGLGVGGGHLIKGHPAQSSTNLAMRCLYTGGWGRRGGRGRGVWGYI